MEDKRHEQLKERLALQNEYTRALAELQSSLGLNRDTGYYRKQKMIDQEFYQNPVQQTYDNYYNALTNRGMSDQDAKAYAMSAIMAPILQKGSGQQRGDGSISPDKQITAMVGVYNALTGRRKELAAQDTEGTNPVIQSQIQDIDAQTADIYSQIQGLSGIQGTAPKFTGDWNQDQYIVALLRQEGQRRGLSWQQIKQAVYERILADTKNEAYAKGAAGLD